jgi:4-hydroxy-4-methyl-2-oxoglutarate aldolase
VMRHDIKPLQPDFVVVGRARTWMWIDVDDVKRPLQNIARALDSLKPGDVCVHNTDHTWRGACFGDLFALTAQKRGATGAVIDRLVRDVKDIIALGFPLFARGVKPNAAGGRHDLVELDVPVLCGDVLVQPGQLIFGDRDGVVVIPAEVEDETIAKALEKLSSEEVVRQHLMKGELFQDVVEYYLSSGQKGKK